MNRFIFKKTKRDFTQLQLSRFDSIKRLSQVTWCKKQSYQKLLKNKALVKKESIHLRINIFIFCAVKHILGKHEKNI